MAKTILSDRPDGCNFYYGFVEGDSRQINVRIEGTEEYPKGYWRAYVGGEPIGCFSTKEFAEQQAIAWIKANPEEDGPTWVGDE